MRRCTDRSLICFSTIGPNNMKELDEFMLSNGCLSPKECADALHACHVAAINEFGQDGGRCYVTNLEPSKLLFRKDHNPFTEEAGAERVSERAAYTEKKQRLQEKKQVKKRFSTSLDKYEKQRLVEKKRAEEQRVKDEKQRAEEMWKSRERMRAEIGPRITKRQKFNPDYELS